MSESDEERAADPATAPEDLARIAHLVPELREVVAGNPSAYPQLREWIAAQQRMTAEPVEKAPVRAPMVPPGESLVAVPDVEVTPLTPRPSRRPGRRTAVGLVLAAAVLLLVGAVAGGAVLGWTASAESQARRVSDEPTAAEVAVPEYGSAAATIMPDVRGLPEDAAREVLADSGITPGAITVSTRAAAGPAGTVIQQTPSFGSEDPVSVTMVISIEATVPEVAGQDSAAVIASLGELGAEVTIVQQYVPGATTGAIQSIEPAPGTPLPGLVTLVVAEPSASVFLSTLDPVDGGCSTGSRGVNGTSFDNSLECSVDLEPTEVSWVVSRAVDSVAATVGVPDDGTPTSRVRVEVLADGVLVASAEAGYGQPADLGATVTGALRLTFRVTLVSAAADSWSQESLVLGDVRLIGGADAMQRLDVAP